MSDRKNKEVLAKRCAMQEAQLTLLSSIAKALINQQKIASVLEDILLTCLKAAGIEKSVLYLFDTNGKLLSQQVLGGKKIDGKKLEKIIGRSPIVAEVFSKKKNLQLSATDFAKNIKIQFLKGSGLTSAVLVPIISETQCFGTLLLGSQLATNLTRDIFLFAQIIGSQIGQAIALENAFNSIISSELRYRQLMDNANCGFIVMNHHGVIIETNKYTENLLNCSKKDLINKDFKEFIIPSMRATVTLQFKKLLQKGILDVNKIKVNPLKQKPRTVYYSSVVTINPKISSERLLLVTVTDVTEFEEFKISMMEKQLQNEVELKKLMRTDSLTKLNNRFSFLESLAKIIKDAKKHNTIFSLILIDIDRFSEINNAFGRNGGDFMLKTLANLIKSNANDLSKVARISDNVFAIIFSGKTKSSITEEFLERLISQIKIPVKFRDKEVYITVSIGISIYPENGKTIEQLIKHANLALQYSKQIGGNNYQLYNVNINEPMEMQLELEADLHQALKQKQLEVYYQPVISIDTQRIVGAEALLRWNHPKYGLVMPDQFIPIAESTELIIPIGEWVFNMACLQVKQWHELGYVDLRVAINLSSRQFNDPGLEKMIIKTLNATHIAPEFLIVEITETVLMQNIDVNSVILQSLSELGITLASDDFGIGYSSLKYLRKLPFDTLKIDKSFINGMEITNQRESIVATIISLAKNLNLKIVAEGVETQAQLDILKKYHCDFMQGYLFSKPIPASAFIKLLQREDGRK